MIRLQNLGFSLAAFITVACGGDELVLPSDTPAGNGSAQIELVQGDGQVGLAGLPLEQELVVELVDQEGNGIPGLPVSWVVASGGGSAVPATAMTDDEGRASATWVLGDPGPNSLAVVVAGVGNVTFTAMATSTDGGSDVAPNATTSTVSADPTAIPVATGTSTIRVTVRNAAGAPVRGAVVTLSASGSGNTITQPSGPTGSNGVVTGTLSSTVPGTKDVSAVVNGTLQIGQTAQVTVTIAPATRIAPVEGNDQRAPVGEAVAVPPAVRVTNSLGEPVVGYGVTFVVTRGGGSVAGASQITNAEGIARVGSWTLGSPGRNELEARAGGLNGNPVVFEATATVEEPPPPPPPPAAEPHHFVFRVPPRDVDRNEWFTVEVAIVDANGNVVPLDGTEVYLGLWKQGNDHPSNSLLAGDRFEDTQNGVAVFNLYVNEPGSYRFKARSDYLPKHLGPYGPELFSNPFEVD